MNYFQKVILKGFNNSNFCSGRGDKMVIIDLFSGAGGLSEGFHQEGFKTVAQVEKDKWACETLATRLIFHFLKEIGDLETYYDYLKASSSYKHLNSEREIIYRKYPEIKQIIEMQVLNKKFGNPQNDSSTTSTNDIISIINESLKFHKKNSVQLMIGGPPCQAYSLIGRSRMKESVEKDPRNFLFHYYKNLVEEYKPKAFVFENVPGLLTAKGGLVLEKIKEEFDRIGYTVLTGESENDKENILDFSDFGVVQRRKRVILFGFQSSMNLQYPNFNDYAISWGNEVTAYHAFSDLHTLQPNQGNDHKLVPYLDSVGLSDYQKFMRKDSIGVVNHKARAIIDRDREIYRLAIEKAKLNEQIKYPELPTKLKTHKNEKGFLDRFKVHKWNDIPHTVVAHISKDGHYNIHPDENQCRSLTVREAARIQGFPDNFKFEGPRTAQFVQVGNAVPPIMSHVIAKAIKEQLS
jgi:DNA (cytosine-5)-methyltransferase 1